MRDIDAYQHQRMHILTLSFHDIGFAHVILILLTIKIYNELILNAIISSAF